MKRLPAALILILTLSALAAPPLLAGPATKELPRSSPEAQGIPSSAILAFIDAAEGNIDALHSLMVLRHGHVVAEGWWHPYREDAPHVLYSLSKSFTSTAVGLAVAEGKMTIDDQVLEYFPEDAPAEPSDDLKALRVRDLLAMSGGHHAKDIAGFDYGSTDPTLTKAFLALPIAHKPGTHFVYNTPGSYMLSAMVQKATGMTLLDYLGPRLFEPLGIEKPVWDASPQGISLGGFGMRIRTEDIARFGQLLLRKGEWQGEQVVPAEWVKAATSRQTANGSDPDSDWEQGYGYQFWRCRHGNYRGDGAFGQYCIVMPELDAVVAITGGLGDMAVPLNLVWEHLRGNMSAEALPAEPTSNDRLARRLEQLSLRPLAGEASSPWAQKVSGKTYVLPENSGGVQAITLEAVEGDADTGTGTVLIIRQQGHDRRVPCGYGEWSKQDTLLMAGVEEPVSASGAWTAEDTYTARLYLDETPFAVTMTLRFTDQQLVLDSELNVSFGPTERPQLIGLPE